MAFPPSFLVNQLIDLMAKQKREAIPNCSVHNNQVTKYFLSYYPNHTSSRPLSSEFIK